MKKKNPLVLLLAVIWLLVIAPTVTLANPDEADLHLNTLAPLQVSIVDLCKPDANHKPST